MTWMTTLAEMTGEAGLVALMRPATGVLLFCLLVALEYKARLDRRDRQRGRR